MVSGFRCSIHYLRWWNLTVKGDQATKSSDGALTWLDKIQLMSVTWNPRNVMISFQNVYSESYSWILIFLFFTKINYWKNIMQHQLLCGLMCWLSVIGSVKKNRKTASKLTTNSLWKLSSIGIEFQIQYNIMRFREEIWNLNDKFLIHVEFLKKKKNQHLNFKLRIHSQVMIHKLGTKFPRLGIGLYYNGEKILTLHMVYITSQTPSRFLAYKIGACKLSGYGYPRFESGSLV